MRNKITSDFESANQQSVGHLVTRLTPPPFIELMEFQVIEKITSTCDLIHKMKGDKSWRIAFSVGIDAVVHVKSCGVYQSCYAIVSGVSPNVMLDISGLDSDQVKAML